MDIRSSDPDRPCLDPFGYIRGKNTRSKTRRNTGSDTRANMMLDQPSAKRCKYDNEVEGLDEGEDDNKACWDCDGTRFTFSIDLLNNRFPESFFTLQLEGDRCANVHPSLPVSVDTFRTLHNAMHQRGPWPYDTPEGCRLLRRFGLWDPLLDWGQSEHVSKIVAWLREGHPSYFDVSTMGRGKTWASLGVARRLNVAVFVVCPASAIDKWRSTAARCGVPVIDALTVQKLRGHGGKVSHPWLHVHRTVEPHGTRTRTRTVYESTPELRARVKAGLLFVLDECHEMRNMQTLNFQACHAITSTLRTYRDVGYVPLSYIALVSSTPADKLEHVLALILLSGLVRASRFYERDFSNGVMYSRNEYTGAREMIQWALRFAKPSGRLVDEFVYYKASQIQKQIYYNFTSFVGPNMTFAMSDKRMVGIDVRNVACLMNEEAVALLRHGFQRLHELFTSHLLAAREARGRAMLEITRTLEAATLPTMLRKAEQWLAMPPGQGKVILVLNFLEHIDAVWMALASRYVTRKYCGSLRGAKATEVLDAFNHGTCRVLLMSLQKGSTNLDLGDEYGDAPRLTLFAPSCYFTKQLQMSGRARRQTSKSRPTVRFLYCKQFPDGERILRMILRKNGVLQRARNYDKTLGLPFDKPMLDEVDDPAFRGEGQTS